MPVSSDFLRQAPRPAFSRSMPSGYSYSLPQLNHASGPNDMAAPNWRMHPLKGDLAGHWAVSVDGPWRLTFTFEGADAALVDYQQYH